MLLHTYVSMLWNPSPMRFQMSLAIFSNNGYSKNFFTAKAPDSTFNTNT